MSTFITVIIISNNRNADVPSAAKLKSRSGVCLWDETGERDAGPLHALRMTMNTGLFFSAGEKVLKYEVEADGSLHKF